MNKSIVSLFFVSAVLTIISFQVYADKTYTYKIAGQDVILFEKPIEFVTKKPEKSDTEEPEESDTEKPEKSDTEEPEKSDTEEPEESDTEEPEEFETKNKKINSVHISYSFSSHYDYAFHIGGGMDVRYNCDCPERCACCFEHEEDCMAHGIIESTFHMHDGPEDEGYFRSAVILLNQLINPLINHFGSYRQEGSQPSGPSDDVLDRTLCRLQASSLSPGIRGQNSSSQNSGSGYHFKVPNMSCCSFGLISASNPAVTVLIPPAALANIPGSYILPLAHITNPVFITNEQGVREAIEFNAQFLQRLNTVPHHPNGELVSHFNVPGRYRINLATGEFYLEIRVEGRAPVEITGNIAPDHEPDPLADADPLTGVSEANLAGGLSSEPEVARTVEIIGNIPDHEPDPLTGADPLTGVSEANLAGGLSSEPESGGLDSEPEVTRTSAVLLTLFVSAIYTAWAFKM